MVLKNLQSRDNFFLKIGMKKMSLNTKLARNILSQIKNGSKKMHFSNLILKQKHYIKKTWEVIKESIRKGNVIIKVFQKTKLEKI